MITNVTTNDIVNTISQKLYPKSMGEIFNWADYMWFHFGRYSNALKNSVRYFLGDIHISANDGGILGSDERLKAYDEMIDTYDILNKLGEVGDEFVQWGNSFTSAEPVIKRNFHCRKCKGTSSAEQYENITYKAGTFKGKCPMCHSEGKVRFTDSIDGSQPLVIKRWNPRLICIDYCPTTKNSDYLIRISDTWKKAFSEQDHKLLVETPLQFLQAIEENKKIKMNKEFFIHLKAPVPSTVEDLLGGWGLPFFMNEFDKVIQLQMLEKYNEVILSDFTVPFRVLSPPGNNTTPDADILSTVNMRGFKTAVGNIIAGHRKNPSAIHITPYPLQYQILGGEASQLIPIETIRFTTEELLTSMCVPLEFGDNKLSDSYGPPIALRRFEKVWGAYISSLNIWLKWFTNARSSIEKQENIRCRLVKSSIYEDDMSREAKTQLALSGIISKDTGLSPLGIRYDIEQSKMVDENNRAMEIDKEEQKRAVKQEELEVVMDGPNKGAMNIGMQQEQQLAAQAGGAIPPGGAPAGGAPPAGQPGVPSPPQGNAADIDTLWAEAEGQAQQIMTLEPSARRSALIQLKKDNPQLHSFVKEQIGTMEQQAGQQGKIAARQGQM